ncbi:MAG: hypothetical protein PVG07_01750 [Acidobacteriota bacterium]|jgi:hypothetical protein
MNNDRQLRTRPVRRLLDVALAVVTALALAAPAVAYVVVLKDGSQIIAEEKYRIQDGQAFIELPNGTVTSIDADEIDVEATEEANAEGYGQALVIERGTTRERTESDSRPADTQRRKSLADLVERGNNERLRLEPRRREEPEESAAPLVRTPAGFVDLQSMPRRPFRDVELASDLQRFFRSQGIDNVELYQGTEPTHPFAEITTNSEASVFRSLEIAAESFLAARENHPDRITALELLLATPDRDRAGQFVLTPAMARELVGEEIDVAEFFVEHVQF